MALRLSTLDSAVSALDRQVGETSAPISIAPAIARFRADAAALRFHLRDAARPQIVVILGGTGTGKSTLLNRLFNATISATSFRRTYTAGPVAVTANVTSLPADWLGIEHHAVGTTVIPARGETDKLVVVRLEHPLTQRVTLVDTPDLDGDQPIHHAQADLAFRWADAVLFLVTPEKYQMTELLPYYRLAKRYAVPTLHAMNKTEQQPAADDYQAQLGEGPGGAFGRPNVFVIPRDDAAFEPPTQLNIGALREAILNLPRSEPSAQHEGLINRAADLLGRFQDQILAPLREERAEADRVITMLRAMETPASAVDVNPLTRQLARRLQQRSILYLIGPQRVLDRVRQVPAMLVRLPRSAWDLLMYGKLGGAGASNGANSADREVPDFHRALAEQFAVVQSRIDDVMSESNLAERGAYQDVKINPDRAGNIADEELAELKAWLEKKWNSTPRDTALLQKFLKYLPGGEKLTQWSEAAPYLLTIIVATHHAFFGHVDLLVLGGYSLATWLTERISNEVTNRVKRTNRRIGERFEQLAHEQIEQMCKWIDSRVPSAQAIEKLEDLGERLATSA